MHWLTISKYKKIRHTCLNLNVLYLRRNKIVFNQNDLGLLGMSPYFMHSHGIALVFNELFNGCTSVLSSLSQHLPSVWFYFRHFLCTLFCLQCIFRRCRWLTLACRHCPPRRALAIGRVYQFNPHWQTSKIADRLARTVDECNTDRQKIASTDVAFRVRRLPWNRERNRVTEGRRKAEKQKIQGT